MIHVTLSYRPVNLSRTIFKHHLFYSRQITLKNFRLPLQIIIILGFQHVESTVTALVDIIHAFAIADPSKVGLAVKQYVRMLLCEVRCCFK